MTGPEHGDEAERLVASLEGPLSRLDQARHFAKPRYQGQVLAVAGRLLQAPGGLDRLYGLATRLDAAGTFVGSDWDSPASLLPGLVSGTLVNGVPTAVAAEAISLLRLLAIAKGDGRDRSSP